MPNIGHDSPVVQQTKDRNAVVLALLRIAVGFFFVIFGQYKVFGSGFVRSGFRDYVEGFIRDGAYPFMVPTLRWILAHAATAMALAVGYGEFLIGISLLIGLFSRVASLFGCALMLAMWLSGGYPGPHAAFWLYWGASLNWSVFAICFVALAIGHPEEVASLRRMISAGSRPAGFLLCRLLKPIEFILEIHCAPSGNRLPGGLSDFGR
jgi:thiosulfate dehydrogenase (quinone) large subunit